MGEPCPSSPLSLSHRFTLSWDPSSISLTTAPPPPRRTLRRQDEHRTFRNSWRDTGRSLGMRALPHQPSLWTGSIPLLSPEAPTRSPGVSQSKGSRSLSLLHGPHRHATFRSQFNRATQEHRAVTFARGCSACCPFPHTRWFLINMIKEDV